MLTSLHNESTNMNRLTHYGGKGTCISIHLGALDQFKAHKKGTQVRGSIIHIQFLLAVEGFNVMMRKVVEVEIFYGFKFKDSLDQIIHL